MPDALTSLVVIALGVVAGLVVIVLVKIGTIARAREAAVQEAGDIRTRLEVMRQTTADFERDLRQDLATARSEQAAGAQAARRELADRLSELTRTNEQRLEAVRATVEQRLDVLRSENAQKLDQMRATVDEKLQTTLDERLGQSFKQVSDRLDQVHKGLGEMQSLAVGVGDLKRVLSNVKRRGTWGEMQLGALLAEILIPGQYGINVETIPGTGRRVEFALRMPGRADEPACWIPIDAKFPVEEWERLQDALERADVEAAEGARKALAGFLRQQAKMVRANYVSPPHTSDFAFLYLPTESLYAEMMARSGLADELQREHRVMIAGPSNFLALLNIVQMGFRTVAIEQRTSEVWLTLGAVRTEFRKFADVLQRAQKKLQEASNTIEEARGKTTTIERRLREVEGVPENESGRLLRGAQSGRLFDDDVADSQAPALGPMGPPTSP
jgi:DNA recombination protein RmuC